MESHHSVRGWGEMGQTGRKLCGERESIPGQGQLGECQSLALGQGMGPARTTRGNRVQRAKRGPVPVPRLGDDVQALCWESWNAAGKHPLHILPPQTF